MKIQDWKMWAGVAYDCFVLYPKWYIIEFLGKKVGRAQYRWEDESDD